MTADRPSPPDGVPLAEATTSGPARDNSSGGIGPTADGGQAKKLARNAEVDARRIGSAEDRQGGVRVEWSQRLLLLRPFTSYFYYLARAEFEFGGSSDPYGREAIAKKKSESPGFYEVCRWGDLLLIAATAVIIFGVVVRVVMKAIQ